MSTPICRGTNSASNCASAPGGPPLRLIVANTHICFNPTKGEVKLGQVRSLIEKVTDRIKAQHLNGQSHADEREGRGPPSVLAVLCGDFNMVPKCPIYDFILSGSVNLMEHSKRKLSGGFENPA